MNMEQSLTETFDAEAGALDVPLDEIVRNSTLHGRRLKRRRNALVATGAASLVTVVAGAAILGGHLYGPGGVDSTAAAASGTATDWIPATPTPTSALGSASPSTSPSAATRSVPATSPSAPTGAGVSSSGAAAADLAYLKTLLPANLKYVKSVVPTFASVDAEFNDGQGAVELSVSVEKDPRYSMASCDGWLGGTNEGPRPADALPPSCTVSTVDGGTEITVVTGTDQYGFYDYEVSLLLPNHTEVDVVAPNGYVDPQNGVVKVTRDLPPVTIADLQSYVAAPGWRATN